MLGHLIFFVDSIAYRLNSDKHLRAQLTASTATIVIVIAIIIHFKRIYTCNHKSEINWNMNVLSFPTFVECKSIAFLNGRETYTFKC